MTTRHRVGLLLCGVTLYGCFFGLTQTAPGMFVSFQPPWTQVSPGEAYLWLGTLLLALPGACLMGVALAPWMVRALAAVSARVERMTPTEQRMGAVMGACLAFGLARVGHAFFLRDFPFTDDEWAARFGGQVLALGKVALPRPAQVAAFPDLFLYGHGGQWAGLDWLGVQLAWATAELTGLGPAVFALAAALGVLGVMGWGARRHGPTGALLAAALYLASPMVELLSFTTHAHVLSRAGLALGLWAFVVAMDKRTGRAWFWTGLALGGAAMTRPFEIVALTAPLIITEVVSAVRRKEAGRMVGGLALGLAIPLVATVIHAVVVTGGIIPPRLASNNEVIHPYLSYFKGVWSPERFWERFGANFSYNLVMLALWFLGPVGLLLVASGWVLDPLSRRLGWGVVASLAVALIHDDHGLHMVGPIHYSDAAVPLTFMAVAGTVKVLALLRERALPTTALVGALCLSLFLAMGTFTVWNGLALRRQAEIHEQLYSVVDDPALEDAVVLAPKYGQVWLSFPRFKQQGSFVFEWRRPRPDLSDRVLVVHDGPGVEAALRALMPERRFYRLRRDAAGQVGLTALTPG
ncbi:glycosyltransferase family 39 protein [Corallococcus sp. M34]|uniref:glycosyltransferase family 39 protein n=1 Tax=Citreicoccus inhibens TaxID=2849499 RepID=UPI001C217D04|nr:glycosyltransferase family 39 protein [Citreicoccus inhibens]MBU8895985.1 glycosyltransferase family 39 protein [Citreicoccus inhibens]